MQPITASAYEIARSSGVCAATGAPLSPGDHVVVALCEHEADEGLDRLDFGAAAWEALPDAERRAFGGRRVFAHWRAAHPEPNAKPKLLIDDDALLEMFESSADDADGVADRRRAAFRFVLALILCRRRLLVLERSEAASAGSTGAIFVRRRTRKDDPVAPLVRVEDPALDSATIAMATDQLGAVLRGDA